MIIKSSEIISDTAKITMDDRRATTTMIGCLFHLYSISLSADDDGWLVISVA